MTTYGHIIAESVSLEISGVFDEFAALEGDETQMVPVPCESSSARLHGVYAIHPEGYATHLMDFETYAAARTFAETLDLPIWERR